MIWTLIKFKTLEKNKLKEILNKEVFSSIGNEFIKTDKEFTIVCSELKNRDFEIERFIKLIESFESEDITLMTQDDQDYTIKQDGHYDKLYENVEIFKKGEMCVEDMKEIAKEIFDDVIFINRGF